jgi:hypothetical protein
MDRGTALPGHPDAGGPLPGSPASVDFPIDSKHFGPESLDAGDDMRTWVIDILGIALAMAGCDTSEPQSAHHPLGTEALKGMGAHRGLSLEAALLSPHRRPKQQEQAASLEPERLHQDLERGT